MKEVGWPGQTFREGPMKGWAQASDHPPGSGMATSHVFLLPMLPTGVGLLGRAQPQAAGRRAAICQKWSPVKQAVARAH